MTRLAFFTLLWSGLLVAGSRADHFAISVQAKTAKEPKPVEATFPHPDMKPPRRPTLTTAAGTPITVKWLVRNTDPSATAKDVLVHFFVVKQEKPDQAEVPKLTRDVLAESALNMDFRPQDRTEAEITFTPANPGCYLLRLELKKAPGKDGRDPFAALDLIVK